MVLTVTPEERELLAQLHADAERATDRFRLAFAMALRARGMREGTFRALTPDGLLEVAPDE